MSSTQTWPVKRLLLMSTSLQDLATALMLAFEQNYVSCSVTVSVPPDLTHSPYHLAAPGLTGSTRIIDVGGPPYLLPQPNLTKKYELTAISQQVGMSSETGFILGAGAGPFHVLGQNSELMPNWAYKNAAAGQDATRNMTHFAKIKEDGTVECRKLENSTAFGLMANLFCSDGLPGECLHIRAKARTGKMNFTETIQSGLKTAFGDRLVSVGGVFLVRKGQVNLHVMPDFPTEPFGARSGVESWLRYFNEGFSEQNPLVCLSVLHSGDDQGLDLRMEHTHCFTVGETGESTTRGGHYHYDCDGTKEEVEYEGWFNVAESVWRVDQPVS